jgi:hypothetical protein
MAARKGPSRDIISQVAAMGTQKTKIDLLDRRSCGLQVAVRAAVYPEAPSESSRCGHLIT